MLLLNFIWIYFSICGLIIACVTVLLFIKSRRWLYGLAISLILTVTLMVIPYSPVILPALGYQMNNLTKPPLFLRGWKNVATILEFRPCAYHLLGWQAETLFYRENCEGGSDKIWKFAADGAPAPEEYRAALPTNLQADLLSTTDSPSVFDWFQAQYVRAPSEFSALSILGLAIRNGVMLSPSHQRLAVVAQHYVYGPQDVLVLSK